MGVLVLGAVNMALTLYSEIIRQKAPAFAVVDMRLEDGNGLDVIAELSKLRPDSRMIVLTDFDCFSGSSFPIKV